MLNQGHRECIHLGRNVSKGGVNSKSYCTNMVLLLLSHFSISYLIFRSILLSILMLFISLDSLIICLSIDI